MHFYFGLVSIALIVYLKRLIWKGQFNVPLSPQDIKPLMLNSTLKPM